jgi:hypothetical protein
MRVRTLRAVLDGFPPKLVETFLGLQKFVWHTWHICMCARRCTLCTPMCAFALFGRIHSKIGGNISLQMLHAFCVCTLHNARACTACMCTIALYWTDSLQNLVEHSTGHRELHGLLLVLRVHLRAHTMHVREPHAWARLHIIGRICSKIGGNIPLHGLRARLRVHAFAHVRTVSLQT